eukprot:g505.t1
MNGGNENLRAKVDAYCLDELDYLPGTFDDLASSLVDFAISKKLTSQSISCEELYNQYLDEKEASSSSDAPLAKTLDANFDPRRALGYVHETIGPFNWALYKASIDSVKTGKMRLVNAGSLSVSEMRKFVDESEVMYGLLRMGFGQGKFRRTKWIGVWFVGSSVSAVKRGKINAVEGKLLKFVKPFTLRLRCHSVKELTTENFIEYIKRAIHVDGGIGDGSAMVGGDAAFTPFPDDVSEENTNSNSVFSLESFQAALAEEAAAARAFFQSKLEEEKEKLKSHPSEKELELQRKNESLTKQLKLCQEAAEAAKQDHQQAIRLIEERHEKEIAAVVAQAGGDRDTALDELNRHHQAEVEELESTIEELRMTLESRGKESAEKMAGQERALEDALSNLSRERTRLEQMQQQSAKEVSGWKGRLEEVESECAEEVRQLRSQMKEAETRYEAEKQAAAAAAGGDRDKALEELNLRHKDEISKLKADVAKWKKLYDEISAKNAEDNRRFDVLKAELLSQIEDLKQSKQEQYDRHERIMSEHVADREEFLQCCKKEKEKDTATIAKAKNYIRQLQKQQQQQKKEALESFKKATDDHATELELLNQKNLSLVENVRSLKAELELSKSAPAEKEAAWKREIKVREMMVKKQQKQIDTTRSQMKKARDAMERERTRISTMGKKQAALIREKNAQIKERTDLLSKREAKVNAAIAQARSDVEAKLKNTKNGAEFQNELKMRKSAEALVEKQKRQVNKVLDEMSKLKKKYETLKLDHEKLLDCLPKQKEEILSLHERLENERRRNEMKNVKDSSTKNHLSAYQNDSIKRRKQFERHLHSEAGPGTNFDLGEVQEVCEPRFAMIEADKKDRMGRTRHRILIFTEWEVLLVKPEHGRWATLKLRVPYKDITAWAEHGNLHLDVTGPYTLSGSTSTKSGFRESISMSNPFRAQKKFEKFKNASMNGGEKNDRNNNGYPSNSDDGLTEDLRRLVNEGALTLEQAHRIGSTEVKKTNFKRDGSATSAKEIFDPFA